MALADKIAREKAKRRAAARRKKELERTGDTRLESNEPPKGIKRGPNFFGEKGKSPVIKSKPGSVRTIIKGDTARKRIEDALK